jgi:hypothetical protein
MVITNIKRATRSPIVVQSVHNENEYNMNAWKLTNKEESDRLNGIIEMLTLMINRKSPFNENLNPLVGADDLGGKTWSSKFKDSRFYLNS